MATWKDIRPHGHSVPSITALVDRNQQLIAENEQLHGQLDAVRKLHTEATIKEEQVCGHCIYITQAMQMVHLVAWPCETIRVLDGGDE